MQGTASGHLDSREGKRGKVWTARLRLPDGSQRRITLGKDWTNGGRPPEGYLTRRMAEAKVRELVVETDRGNVVKRERLGSFGDACEAYLRDGEWRHSTTLNKENLIKQLVGTFGAETRLDQITPAVVEQNKAAWINAGLSAATIKKRLGTLACIFKFAGVPNPCEGVKRPKADKPSGAYRAYEPAQVLALANNADKDYGPLFMFAAFTGLRMSELRALRWDKIDRERKLIYVEAGYVRGEEGLPKSGKVRSVPLVNQAESALDQLPVRGDLVFMGTRGERLNDQSVREAMRRAIKAAGLPYRTFHELRHTFATIMVRVLPLSDVQRILGHSHIQTTMIYLHSKPMDEQTDKLNNLINGALAPTLNVVTDDGRKAA